MEAAVIDAGSSLLKAGFAISDQTPAMIIPSQMKRMVDESNDNGNGQLVVDDAAVEPVVRGYVRDWDAMEDLLNYVLYSGLGWEIEQAVLSLYAVGRISGCTVDTGHGKIDIAPVVEGDVNHIASRRFEFGGTDLTNFLAQELGRSDPLVYISMSDVEKIKQQYSCCAEDDLAYQKAEDSCPVDTHTLPDGQVLKRDFRRNLSHVHLPQVKPLEYMPENLTMYSAWVGGAILAKVVFPQNQHELN